MITMSAPSKTSSRAKKSTASTLGTKGDTPLVQPHQRLVSIAIQGGGAHGAFSWGVMDRLLEDGRFVIEGMTGTSAGGMNAVATAQGLMRGGPEQARVELRNFWQEISNSGKHSSLNHPGPLDRMMGKHTMYNSFGFMMFDFLSRIFSPYELNPMGYDPLEATIEKCFDFESLQKYQGCKLFLCATHVASGKLQVFNLQELKKECLLATACLPTIHNAVKVNGEYYWDGGFVGNPVFFPLIYNCTSPDIIFIQLNPMTREKLPTTSREISDRLNEITNNASVIREMRAIHLISKLIDDGLLDKNRMKRVHMHVIQHEETFRDLGWSSKLNTDWNFLTYLFEQGRMAADRWIKDHFDKVGQKSSLSIEDEYVGEMTDGGGTAYQ